MPFKTQFINFEKSYINFEGLSPLWSEDIHSTKLIAKVTNGLPPYTFAWSTLQTDTGFIYIDSSGIYSLTVTDAAHCVASGADTVFGTRGLKIDSIASLNTECPYTDGYVIAAKAYVSGGAQPYTYLWSSGEHSATAVNLTPSVNNTVLATDINNCSVTANYLFVIPPQVTATDSSFAPVCYTNPIGSMNVYIYNGFVGPNGTGDSVIWYGHGGGINYSFAGMGGATQYPGYLEDTASLPPDYYQYIVTDYYGCTYTGYDSVKQPLQITFTLDTINCSCNGDNTGGAAITNIQSNNLLYFIFWSNQQSGPSISNLSYGDYSATLTDANNCMYPVDFYVSQPQPLKALVDSGMGITCHNGTATVNINGAGGTPPYVDTATYQLSAGTYNFFIEDSNSCITTFSFKLTNPPVFSDSVWVTQPGCTNGYQSVINVSTVGGVAPYEVVVDSMYYQSFYGFGQVNGVPPGMADVVVSDAHGCTLNSSAHIDSNFQAQDTILPNNPLCSGSNTGSATIIVTAGQAPFSYNGNQFYTTYTIPNLDTGSYTFSIYDSLGCSTSLSVTLTSPATLSAIDSITTPVLCNGMQATVLVTASGGIPPYTGTGSLTYPAGFYQLTVTDSNGCQANLNLTVNQPDPLIVAISYEVAASCDNGGNNGYALINAVGGTLPFVYNWSDNEHGPSPSVNDLVAGYYTFTVTDSNLCQDTGSFTMYSYNGWQAAVDSTNACTGNNGTATVQISNGPPIVFFGFQCYDQFNNFISSADTIKNLAVGQYSVIITNSNTGCDTTIHFNIVLDTVSFVITNDTGQGIECNGGLAYINISATGGFPPYNGIGQYSFSTGINVVQVSDQSGCAVSDTFNLWQPALPLHSSVTQSSLICSATSGSVLITTTGGVPPYSLGYPFFYNYGDTISVVDTPGNYSGFIVDSIGCQQNIFFAITHGNVLYGTLANSNPTCNGLGNGQTIINMQNGYQPYLVNGNYYYTTTLQFDSLTADTTTYLVTDSLGCAAIFTVSLSQPGGLIIDSNLLQGGISCTGRNDAVISVTATGGTLPYIYGLVNLNTSVVTTQSNSIFNALGPDSYIITVTDSNNCSKSFDVNIPVYSLDRDSLVVDSVPCYAGNGGAIKVYSIPADHSPYSYSLNGGIAQASNIFYNLPANTYQIIVADAHNCLDTLSAVINQPDSIDGRVWLNGDLLPKDSIILNSVSYANFTKLSTTPWSVTFSPVIPYTINTDTLVQVQPRQSLTYTVTLYLDSNDKGCFIQYTGFIDVLVIPEFPNTITPNGDGINDVWKIDLIKYPNADVTIFDRWGEVVYASTDYNNDWAGIDQKNGKPLPDGTYFYLLKIPSQGNAVYKGDINIVDAPR